MRKSWGFLSEAEINVLKKNQCMKCRYFSKTSKNNTFLATSVCNYILNKGHSRKCDPRDCIKSGRFEEMAGRRKKR
nr:MAG TPA: hypothetical protein [Caudoviricetes sp.]DAO07857.1 MAG TPA: hypothetical protein [Caudoviricetes sp.]